MSISDYISKLESVINSFPITVTYSLTIDRKTNDIALISGKIEFRNDAILDFKEFIEDTEHGVEKYKYAYNLRAGEDIIFRYDNAPDPRVRRLKTFPYHKHLKGGEIIESHQIELSDVLEEIERTYINDLA
ncbi:MAG: hypothetical protein HY578_05625 [Nitrospinae bacterium]|nr:hypothetical protein [Nitrospinota bacterium]